MTAARWRDVGEDLAAALGHQLADSLGLGADLGRGPDHVMMVPDTSIRLVI